jgi:aspartate carbamoyltransferase catalytic subunit
VLSAADVTRVVDRMAHQLIEKCAGGGGADDDAAGGLADLVLVGIPTRGAPLARRLAARVEAFSGSPVDVGTVDITLYRDDLRMRGVRALEETVLPEGGIDGRLVVLVDDVLYSGRSVRAALDALRDLGRPRAVQLAVLVDRGHRELPIRADYVGKNLPTSRAQQVRVHLAETDGTDEVLVVEGERRGSGRRGGPGGRGAERPRGRPGEQGVKRHLLEAADLDRADATLVLDTAAQIDAALAGREVKKLPTLRGRTVVNLFYEDSTRTRISFELAAKRLSADVINFSAKGSSVSKGESLKDTALTLEAMGSDAIVVRHPASGAPHRLANWVRGSVVNAGDGTHEHPTQALLDAYTIRHRLGRLEGVRVAVVGDVLHSRVARSNVRLLHTLGAEVTLVAPADAAAGRRGQLAGGGLLRPGRRPAQGRRGDDAAGPGRADERLVLPQRPGVQPPLRPGRAPDGGPGRRRDRHAPGPDEPRDGDRRRGGRLRPLHDRRAGRQRGLRAHGRALPAAGRRAPAMTRASINGGATPYGEDAADILVRDGRIAAIGASLSATGAEVLDATGLVALPGLVDLHTHLREPGREDAETVETGSRAAALGGYTAVHAMANTDPVADTAGVVEQVWRLGQQAGLVDVVPVGAVTVGLRGERLAELGAMADSAARVRVFSDDGHCVADPALMRRALEYVKALRRRRRPARRGAAAHRRRADARGRPLGPPRADRLAGRRRGGDHRPRRAARRARRRAAARLPRLDRGLGGDPPVGEGPAACR